MLRGSRRSRTRFPRAQRWWQPPWWSWASLPSRCASSSGWTCPRSAQEKALAERVGRVELEVGAPRPEGGALDLGDHGRKPAHLGFAHVTAREHGADDRQVAKRGAARKAALRD